MLSDFRIVTVEDRSVAEICATNTFSFFGCFASADKNNDYMLCSICLEHAIKQHNDAREREGKKE